MSVYLSEYPDTYLIYTYLATYKYAARFAAHDKHNHGWLRPFCHHHVLRGANRGEYLVGNFNSKYAWYSIGDFNRMGFTRDLSMMPLFGSGGGVVWCRPYRDTRCRYKRAYSGVLWRIE